MSSTCYGSSTDPKATKSAISAERMSEQKEFREVIGEIASLMCYEATKRCEASGCYNQNTDREMVGKS